MKTWEEFDKSIDEMLKWKHKEDKKLKKQGFHNIGPCLLCGGVHYTDDPILSIKETNHK